jgi:hypothetical protein
MLQSGSKLPSVGATRKKKKKKKILVLLTEGFYELRL